MVRIPLSTYRLQFRIGFGFRAARDIGGYLADLGISDLYASPIFKARAGSSHGYDVVDHTAINDELGTMEDMEALARDLRGRGMGWLQDIVPNHMAYHSENRLLMDVLENSAQSRYLGFFDIEWNHHDESLKGKLLAPILGGFFGECLENGDITLGFGEQGLSVRYFEHVFPLRIESYAEVLGGDLATLRKRMDRKHTDYVKLMGAFYILKNLPDGSDPGERYDQIHFIKSMLWELYESNPVIKLHVDDGLRKYNGSNGNPASFKKLAALLSKQNYRLAYWRVGVEEVNYRRFFAVNDLISLRIEDRWVFDHVHRLPLKLLAAGVFTGLRVDHIDGLYDPRQYLERLREAAPEAYLTVEKILAAGETLKTAWPVQGTTGYEFLAMANGLFVMGTNADKMDSAYRNFTGMQSGCGSLANDNKRLLIEKDLYGGLENLVYQLKAIATRFTHASDFTLPGFRRALEEVFVHFPVYRTYISEAGADDRDRQVIAWTLEKARAGLPSHAYEIDFIESMLLTQTREGFSKEEKRNALEFAMRLQQFTSPLMAKGIEDTFLYVFNRMISLNDVGSNPDYFGTTPDEFHAFNRQRLAAWPHTQNATATHDTKRGEDARARIDVISELPDEWEAKVTEWHQANKGFRLGRNAHFAPDRNDEYSLYQALLGAWPIDDADLPDFRNRMREYLVKAVREAKVHTVWVKPDREYEDAFLGFLDRILDPESGKAFLDSFRPFQHKAAWYGMWNGLSQALLKITAPGVPDFYQGCEYWGLSLVDPDNRRPVDYVARIASLQAIRAREGGDIGGLARGLASDPWDGRCKQFLIYRALKARNALPSVFQYGEYLPLAAEGEHKDSLVAFGRTFGRHWVVTVAPRFLAGFVAEGTPPMGRVVWGDTRLRLPGEAPVRWTDSVGGGGLQVEGGYLALGDIFARFPAALLVGET